MQNQTTRRALRPLLLALVPVLLGACVDTGMTLPATRWDQPPDSPTWTRTTLSAVAAEGVGLVDIVPADIATYCPGYEKASDAERAAFWTGLFSALSYHESTWNPEAKGQGGAYRGLLQISPGTARGYGCDTSAPGGLYNADQNLACAVKIAAHQVRDTGLVAGRPGHWGGLALDWQPMRSAAKRAEMASWTREQSYCQG